MDRKMKGIITRCYALSVICVQVIAAVVLGAMALTPEAVLEAHPLKDAPSLLQPSELLQGANATEGNGEAEGPTLTAECFSFVA